MTVSRRAFALSAFALSASGLVGASALPAMAQSGSGLSAADRALVDQAVGYFQSMNAAQGDFIETGPGGQQFRGRFWLQRPGRMRFEYTQPQGLLVVADGSNLNRYDPRLNVFRQAPLSATPLSAFLARDVRLDQTVRVERVTRMANGGFSMVARSARNPNEGSVTLVFSGSPLRLLEWTVTDAQGQRTRTQLNNLQPARNLNASLFVLRDPTRRPGR
ncbi:MAG: LolA family protein [Brevundimonas sp.]|uniref:LolA family protein n=1 Tax=Brevundimonas sp. TaxID=1871086 RepID=UPI0039193C05